MTDPVIEFLGFEDQRHYVWILCMKNEGILDKKYPSKDMREKVIARRLGLQGEAFESFKVRIISSKLVNKNLQPTKWNDLQFKSDSSKDRVSAYRERKKKEKEQQKCNVTVTAQDTDTDTDTDTEKEIDKTSIKHKGILLEDLPIDLSRIVVMEFIDYRAKKKSPLDQAKFNRILKKALDISSKISLSAEQIFTETMDRGWAGFDLKYFNDYRIDANANNRSNENSGSGRQQKLSAVGRVREAAERQLRELDAQESDDSFVASTF
jgi:hypothetical protein